MTVSIEVQNVTKMFTMQYHRTLKQMAVASVKRLPLQEKFLAVNDVSFEVQQGEAIGLMGLNGSGKSTLLKLINGVMRPDEGTIRTRGRIAGLIATGAGFHPQLTGRGVTNEREACRHTVVGKSIANRPDQIGELEPRHPYVVAKAERVSLHSVIPERIDQSFVRNAMIAASGKLGG